jgi:hypothetical protein
MTVENTNSDNEEWYTTNSTYLSSPNSAAITYNISQAMDDWFFTQGLQLTAGTTYEVSFSYRTASRIYPEKIAVDWGNTAAASSMSESPIFNNDYITNTDWIVGSGIFTPTATGAYYVGFHGYSDADKFYLFIDDITVYEPSCPTPTTQTYSNSTTTRADLGWTDATGLQWDLYIVPTGDPAPVAGSTPTINDTQNNPYTWTGGTGDTYYDWYVRSDCGQDNTSDISLWT